MRERLPELVDPEHVKGGHVGAVKKSRQDSGQSQQVGRNIKGHLGFVASPTWGGKRGVVLKGTKGGAPIRGVL